MLSGGRYGSLNAEMSTKTQCIINYTITQYTKSYVSDMYDNSYWHNMAQ